MANSAAPQRRHSSGRFLYGAIAWKIQQAGRQFFAMLITNCASCPPGCICTVPVRIPCRQLSGQRGSLMLDRNGFRNIVLMPIAASLLTGCVAYGGIDPYYPDHHYPSQGAHGTRGAYDIPPGHMPPPGECRIWYPDRPPGQQPPPGDCYELQRRVPPRAVLVRG
jgi:hypothetical protein